VLVVDEGKTTSGAKPSARRESALTFIANSNLQRSEIWTTMSFDQLQGVGPSQSSQMPPSMSSMLLQPLNDLQVLSQAMFVSLSSTQPRPPPMPPVEAFLDCDNRLAAAVQLARRHQMNYRRIEAIKDEIIELERCWHESCIELETGNNELKAMIDEAGERLQGIELSGNGICVHCSAFNSFDLFVQAMCRIPN
jgi:hypothetical protein